MEQTQCIVYESCEFKLDTRLHELIVTCMLTACTCTHNLINSMAAAATLHIRSLLLPTATYILFEQNDLNGT